MRFNKYEVRLGLFVLKKNYSSFIYLISKPLSWLFQTKNHFKIIICWKRTSRRRAHAKLILRNDRVVSLRRWRVFILMENAQKVPFNPIFVERDLDYWFRCCSLLCLDPIYSHGILKHLKCYSISDAHIKESVPHRNNANKM